MQSPVWLQACMPELPLGHQPASPDPIWGTHVPPPSPITTQLMCRSCGGRALATTSWEPCPRAPQFTMDLPLRCLPAGCPRTSLHSTTTIRSIKARLRPPRCPTTIDSSSSNNNKSNSLLPFTIQVSISPSSQCQANTLAMTTMGPWVAWPPMMSGVLPVGCWRRNRLEVPLMPSWPLPVTRPKVRRIPT